MVHSDSILCFMKGWVRCMCALTGHIGVLSWCQDQRLPPTYLQDFFQVREDLLKSLLFPILHSCRPSTIPQQFSFSKTLYSFSKSSPNIFILQIFLLLHKKNSLFKYFSSQFFHPHKKIFSFYKCFPSFYLHSSSHKPNNNYFPLPKYFPSFLSPLLAPEVPLEDLWPTINNPIPSIGPSDM